MTRRTRISTVEEADAAMERLGWLRGHGNPNGAVRELFECATAYRAAVHRQGSVKDEPGHVARLEKKRN
jgi:hypothetical protein